MHNICVIKKLNAAYKLHYCTAYTGPATNDAIVTYHWSCVSSMGCSTVSS
jgi:hypothetical protein